MKKASMLAVLSVLVFSAFTLTGCGMTPYLQPCTLTNGDHGTQNIFGECYRDRNQ
jgi:hypothetical protein